MKPYDAADVMRYRAAVGRVSERAETLTDGAAPGLQDGTPWSGLLSLHLRAEAVTAESWRDPSLVQVFGLRGAVYLIRRVDLGIFTAGLLPRNEEAVDELRRKAALVAGMLADGPMSQAAVVEAVPEIEGPRELRRVSNAGGFIPVWDTTDTVLHAVDSPVVDARAARMELTLHFFRYLGPAWVEDLAWWLGVTLREARARIAEVEGFLVEVETTLGPLMMLSSLRDVLGRSPDLPEVLLLPPEDPLITRPTTRPWLPADIADRVWPKAPPPGVVLLGGAVVGTWRRRRGNLIVSVFAELEQHHHDEIVRIGADLPLPYPEEPTVEIIPG